MGDRMKSQAHGGCRENRRAWATGCRRGGLKMPTQEGAGRGPAEWKHGAWDEHGEKSKEGQEVAGMMPEEEYGQHGGERRGDERWEHGPPEGGPGTRSAAAKAGTVGYGYPADAGVPDGQQGTDQWSQPV